MKRFLLAGATCSLAVVFSGGSAGALPAKKVDALAQTFAPKTVRIAPGQKVTWEGVEGTHTVTMRKGPFSKALQTGGTVSKRFGAVGTFKYYCIPHESLGMTGKVVVTE